MITLSASTRDVTCWATVSTVDVAGPGKLVFRDANGNELAVFDLQRPAFNAPTDGKAMARGLPLTTRARAAGRVSWYEATDAKGHRAWTGTVSAPGDGGDLVLDNPELVRGQSVTLTDWTHVQP